MARHHHVIPNTADAVQDALAEVLRDLAKLREPAAFRARLFRIAFPSAQRAHVEHRLAELDASTSR